MRTRHKTDDAVAATAAVTAVANDFTWTANDPAVADGAATIADGDTVGDDNDAGDALSVLEVQGNANMADIAAIKTELAAIRAKLGV